VPASPVNFPTSITRSNDKIQNEYRDAAGSVRIRFLSPLTQPLRELRHARK
jgi:hypothetical protein